MCGIVGIATPDATNDREKLDRMRDTLAHRGPDDCGTWWSENGRVGLAHRRLSIIDLSAAGHQPMLSADKNLALTFNGEIYNFLELKAELQHQGWIFRTKTDTEVILAGYAVHGLDVLAKLDGMFAFALLDLANKRLVLARDRAGEKPLYYWQCNGSLTFASELKALMADPSMPREVDPQALDQYLAYGYVSAPLTMLTGVSKLQAGHALVFDLETGITQLHQYWQPPVFAGDPDADADVLTEEFADLLRASVRRRLIADVPVGVLLSGGLDSSLVTAMAAEESDEPVRTFTIGFPGGGRFDETAHARRVAEHFGTRHVELPVDAAGSDLLPELVRQFDEPVADSSMIPTYVVSRLVREHCSVALAGDAGDELFGGYKHYHWLQSMDRYRRRIPATVRNAGGCVTAALMPNGAKGRTYALGFSGDAAHMISHVDMYFDRRARHAIAAPELRRYMRQLPDAESLKRAYSRTDRSLLDDALRVDFATYLPEDILAKVDRASMLTSLEVRAPFLDHRIIEFAFARIPDKLKVQGSERKILLRRLAGRLLPRDFDTNRKQGFSVPLDQWLAGDFGRSIAHMLVNEGSPLLDSTAVARLVRLQAMGLANGKRLFALGLLEMWRRTYDVQAPAV